MGKCDAISSGKDAGTEAIYQCAGSDLPASCICLSEGRTPLDIQNTCKERARCSAWRVMWISTLHSLVLLQWRSVSSGAASRWPGGSPGGEGGRLFLFRFEAKAAMRLARRSLSCLGAS